MTTKKCVWVTVLLSIFLGLMLITPTTFVKNWIQLQTIKSLSPSNQTKRFQKIMNENNMNVFKQLNKVISYSLYGTNPCYYWGAIENALIAKELFPDWMVYVFVEDKLSSLLSPFKNLENVKLIMMNSSRSARNTMWRFLPAFDDNIDVIISRDTDSRLIMRDKVAVYQWLESDKDFHIIREAYNHVQLILAGMWGARNHILKPFKSKFDKFYYDKNQTIHWGDDQSFLATVVYPYIVQKNKSYAFVHDQYQASEALPSLENPQQIPFPFNAHRFIGHSTCKDFGRISQIYGVHDITNHSQWRKDRNVHDLTRLLPSIELYEKINATS